MNRDGERAMNEVRVTTTTVPDQAFLVALSRLCMDAMASGLPMVNVVGLLHVHAHNLGAAVLESLKQPRSQIAVPDAPTTKRLNGHGG